MLKKLTLILLLASGLMAQDYMDFGKSQSETFDVKYQIKTFRLAYSDQNIDKLVNQWLNNHPNIHIINSFIIPAYYTGKTSIDSGKVVTPTVLPKLIILYEPIQMSKIVDTPNWEKEAVNITKEFRGLYIEGKPSEYPIKEAKP
jgi:hypothetical protein